MISSPSVSYTHLDVYKRQTYLLLLLAGVFGAFSALFHKFPIPGAPELLVISLAATAVFACIGFLPSQIRRWVWLILLALWLVTAWQFREPVSYTHLACSRPPEPTTKTFILSIFLSIISSLMDSGIPDAKMAPGSEKPNRSYSFCAPLSGGTAARR